MMQQHLKLREIIWEITGECKNGCKFCGSSMVWNDHIDEEKIIYIANRIALFPPEQIDISGGDPLLVSYDTHKIIVDLLTRVGTKCKIIINPKSINKSNISILKLYSWMGISINSQSDIDIFRKILKNYKLRKFTIITNFNLENIFEYDYIESFIKEYNFNWQIQYTTFMDEKSTIAIYNNEASTNYLFSKIQTSLKSGLCLILADNLNCGECTAGHYSIGILSNGDVVPCLSMRSWVSNINSVVQGNLLISGLEKIWIEGFKDVRFKEFKCCKDHCNKKQMQGFIQFKQEDLVKKPPMDLPPCVFPPSTTPINYPPYKPTIYVVYGVPDGDHPIVTMYAVFTPFDNARTDIIKTSTSIDDEDDLKD